MRSSFVSLLSHLRILKKTMQIKITTAKIHSTTILYSPFWFDSLKYIS